MTQAGPVMHAPPLVVIGASTGGVEALRMVCSALPADFGAAVLVVLHVDAHPSILPGLLTRAGPLNATHAIDGELLLAGRIYVAPPDHHMLIDGERIRVLHGPKEHGTRPAVDPLFRSAADQHGRRVAGVVLTGALNDGADGLMRIKEGGGRTLAQDPREAVAPDMPQHALVRGAAELAATLTEIPAILTAWVNEMTDPDPLTFDPPNVAASLSPEDIDPHSAQRTPFVCPSCKGSLKRTNHVPYAFDCYTGHRFTLETLAHAQDAQTDGALWSAYRALREKTLLLLLLVEESKALGDEEQALAYERRARDAQSLAKIALGVATRATGTLVQPA
jgi:two-component system chemotaxis response regulator CheB